MRRLKNKFVAHHVYVEHIGGASVKASNRSQEERLLSKEFWPRNVGFDWTKRIAILGLGPGIPGPLWTGIDQAAVEFAREGATLKHFNLETLDREALHGFKPDAVIACSGTGAIERVRPLTQGITCPIGFWFNDLRTADDVKADRFERWFTHLFLCFADDPAYRWADWERKTRAKVFYMPQGSKVVTELAPLQLERELVFIGDIEMARFHGDRRAIVNALGATVLNGAQKSQERRDIEARSRETYRHSRYCLSVSPNVAGYTSLRTFNIMAYGGLALIRNYPGLSRLFTHGHHALNWKTLEEALMYMNIWKGLPDEAERIRKRAWRYGQARHTAMRRVQNMVSNMTTGDKEFWGWAS